MVQQTRKNQQYSDHDIFTVIGCIFQNCQGGTDWDGYIRGGAIKYQCGENKEGNVTIYGSTFENCKTNKGDGGAIFLCQKEVASNFDSNHTLANYFNSSYCCYSKCTATGTDKEREAGYGPVMFIFAKTIEIFYSTAVECFENNKTPYGAQFDLKSEAIRSSYINSTKGKSYYCCAMEYRSAKNGYFKYQTFVELDGGFLTSFTDLEKTLDISYCNYINDNIISSSDQNGAFIYVRNCDVQVSNFCFVGININGGFDFVHFAEKGHSITLKDSFIEKKIESYLSGVTTYNVQFYNDNDPKHTNKIELLELGPCEGEITPPPTMLSNTFAPSDDFSPSFLFTKSGEFSKTAQFSETNDFSQSKKFSESQEFKQTQDFSKSEEFSETQKFQQTQEFSKSKEFSETQKFQQTQHFSESKKFSESHEFSQSDNLPQKERPTKTNEFTSSNSFTASRMFSNSHRFSESCIFSESNLIVDREVNLQDNGKGKGLPTGAIVGIAIAAAAVVAIPIVAFFIIRAKKMANIISEGVDMNDLETKTVNTANPLYGEGADDPFREDFENNN